MMNALTFQVSQYIDIDGTVVFQVHNSIQLDSTFRQFSIHFIKKIAVCRQLAYGLLILSAP